jgi:signal transduction histidine kinase
LTLTALAYVMVRRWLRPLDDIGTGARRFGAGNFSQPIPVRHAHAPDELGQLAQTINTMGRDIHQMLEAKRTLLLAISHELRSPLTRARLHVELLPEDLLHIASQRQALLRDLTGMAQLIGDLLESERLSGSHQGLHQEWVDVAALIQESTTQAAMTVVLHMGADVPVRCWLDAGRLKLLLRNLLHNTLRHGHGTTTPPELGLTWEPTPTTERPTQGCLHLCVRDHGPGVAPDHLPHLAQAFYRPDSARTRESGGVGLGLYLCRLIAQAHGGRMDMHNAHPGLRVHVQLPTVAPAQATSST